MIRAQSLPTILKLSYPAVRMQKPLEMLETLLFANMEVHPAGTQSDVMGC